MTTRLLARFAALLAALAASTALAASLPMASGPSEVVVGEQAAAPAKLRLTAKALGPRLQLSTVTEDEVEFVRSANRSHRGKREMIGVNREAPLAPVAVNWAAVDGGHATRLSASSPDAAALRLAIDVRGLPMDTQMVFFGSGNAMLLGPIAVGSIADLTQPWWSPITEGEAQTVEFFLPAGHDAAGLAPRVTSVSHLFLSPTSNSAKNAAHIGLSGSCNIDIQCVASPSQALLNTRNSVAKMTFTVPGGTARCTGSMLTDLDTSTQIPWFYGANHCFDNDVAPFKTPAQMQATASTLNTYWFFEAATCGSLATPNFVQRTGGATFLYNSVGGDVLFLRLNEPPPAGSVLSGWDANTIGAGANVTALHHPLGDLKKFSTGVVQRFSDFFPTAAPNSAIEIVWNQGTTEPGSSGSGIWTFNGQSYVFRGGLQGGAASCSNLTGPDYYSRFDQAYPALAPFLAASTATTNYTALWYNSPAESEAGWGINLNHQSNIIFATLFNYASDNQSTWVVASNLALQGNGSFSGQLFRLQGPPFFNVPWLSSQTVLNTVGTMTLSFSGPSTGTLTYSINGITVTKTITRQIFSSPVPTCTLGTGSRAGLTNYQDLWFNPNEQGWGINFTHQGNIIFATLFNYDSAGRDLWFVANNLSRQANGSYAGQLFITTGPAFNSVPFLSSQVSLLNVGTMSVSFTNGENGVLSYTAGGNTVTKNITRQVFGNTVPFCQ